MLVVVVVVVVFVVVVVVVFVVVFFFFKLVARPSKSQWSSSTLLAHTIDAYPTCSVRRQPRAPDTIVPLALLQLDLYTKSSVLSNNDNLSTAKNAILKRKIALFSLVFFIFDHFC